MFKTSNGFIIVYISIEIDAFFNWIAATDLNTFNGNDVVLIAELQGDYKSPPLKIARHRFMPFMHAQMNRRFLIMHLGGGDASHWWWYPGTDSILLKNCGSVIFDFVTTEFRDLENYYELDAAAVFQPFISSSGAHQCRGVMSRFSTSAFFPMDRCLLNQMPSTNMPSSTSTMASLPSMTTMTTMTTSTMTTTMTSLPTTMSMPPPAGFIMPKVNISIINLAKNKFQHFKPLIVNTVKRWFELTPTLDLIIVYLPLNYHLPVLGYTTRVFRERNQKILIINRGPDYHYIYTKVSLMLGFLGRSVLIECPLKWQMSAFKTKNITSICMHDETDESPPILNLTF